MHARDALRSIVGNVPFSREKKSPPGLLHGDNALVTGAAAGIGRAIAERLAAEGARVLATDIDAPAVETLVNGINRNGGRSAGYPGDLRDRAFAGGLAQFAIEQLSHISILVHCANPRLIKEGLLATGDEQMDAMYDVNVRAALKLTQHIGAHMVENAVRGRILFITSLHTATPRSIPAYSIAKAGLHMLMTEAATLFGPKGIRVNAIAPGIIPIDLPKPDTVVPQVSMRRYGRPHEIAGAAAALLSDRFSSYVHGQTIVVDGGLSLYNWINPPQ